MINKLLQLLVTPMPDDMTSTKYHIKQIERSIPRSVRKIDVAEREGEIVRSAMPYTNYAEPVYPFCPLTHLNQ